MSEHSRRPDDLLTKPRTAILFELNHNGTRPKDSLKQMTVGHQYFRQHLEKPKSSQYLKLNPGRFQLMCERPEVQYGKVVQVHVLRSENCPFSDLSLKELATKRLKMREDLMDIPDLTTYIKYRKSCWFLEETEDGQFRCDCPIGHKGKVCKHELALNYLHKRIEVLPHAAALPLGRGQRGGRKRSLWKSRRSLDIQQFQLLRSPLRRATSHQAGTRQVRTSTVLTNSHLLWMNLHLK